MKLKGIGRRGALKIVHNTIRDIPFSDHREALGSWLSRRDAGVSKSEFADIWASGLEQLNRKPRERDPRVFIHDEGYPKRLRRIPDPPALLFVKGKTGGLYSRRESGRHRHQETDPPRRKGRPRIRTRRGRERIRHSKRTGPRLRHPRPRGLP